MIAKWKKYTKQELQSFLDQSESLQSFMSKMGYSTSAGSNTQTAHYIIEKYNLDLSQLQINRNNAIIKKKKKRKKNKEELEKYFVSHSTLKRYNIRKIIIANNLIPYVCSFCGNDGHWLDKTLALELDHINGINNDNRLENLRWLCPNCHAITDTYCGKNIKNKSEKIENRCEICGQVISKRAKKCIKCYHQTELYKEQHSKECPVDRQKLKDLIRNHSFLSIGNMYNVSDNAIRLWCIRYNLPHKKKDIKNISDEIWETL